MHMSKHTLHNEFTAIIERDGKWYKECKKNLADAIALILQDRREDAQRGLPADAVQDVVSLS